MKTVELGTQGLKVSINAVADPILKPMIDKL